MIASMSRLRTLSLTVFLGFQAWGLDFNPTDKIDDDEGCKCSDEKKVHQRRVAFFRNRKIDVSNRNKDEGLEIL
jgi:hypothetical protein